MFCPNCGTQLPNEAAFCANCGTRLNPQPEAAPYVAPEAQPQATPYMEPEAPNQGYIPYPPVEGGEPFAEAPKKNKTPLLIGIVAAAVAVVVLLVVLLGGGGGNGSPEAVAEKFFSSVLSGDIEAAEECVHPDMWQDIGGDFEEVGGMMAMFGDSVKFTVNGSEKVTDDERDDVQEMLDQYGIDDKLGDVYAVEISMTVNLFGMEQTETDDILVAEIDGDYYVVEAD